MYYETPLFTVHFDWGLGNVDDDPNYTRWDSISTHLTASTVVLLMNPHAMLYYILPMELCFCWACLCGV